MSLINVACAVVEGAHAQEGQAAAALVPFSGGSTEAVSGGTLVDLCVGLHLTHQYVVFPALTRLSVVVYVDCPPPTAQVGVYHSSSLPLGKMIPRTRSLLALAACSHKAGKQFFDRASSGLCVSEGSGFLPQTSASDWSDISSSLASSAGFSLLARGLSSSLSLARCDSSSLARCDSSLPDDSTTLDQLLIFVDLSTPAEAFEKLLSRGSSSELINNKPTTSLLPLSSTISDTKGVNDNNDAQPEVRWLPPCSSQMLAGVSEEPLALGDGDDDDLLAPLPRILTSAGPAPYASLAGASTYDCTPKTPRSGGSRSSTVVTPQQLTGRVFLQP